jgi:hypothetical protein
MSAIEREISTSIITDDFRLVRGKEGHGHDKKEEEKASEAVNTLTFKSEEYKYIRLRLVPFTYAENPTIFRSFWSMSVNKKESQMIIDKTDLTELYKRVRHSHFSQYNNTSYGSYHYTSLFIIKVIDIDDARQLTAQNEEKLESAERIKRFMSMLKRAKSSEASR